MFLLIAFLIFTASYGEAYTGLTLFAFYGQSVGTTCPSWTCEQKRFNYTGGLNLGYWNDVQLPECVVPNGGNLQYFPQVGDPLFLCRSHDFEAETVNVSFNSQPTTQPLDGLSSQDTSSFTNDDLLWQYGNGDSLNPVQSPNWYNSTCQPCPPYQCICMNGKSVQQVVNMLLPTAVDKDSQHKCLSLLPDVHGFKGEVVRVTYINPSNVMVWYFTHWVFERLNMKPFLWPTSSVAAAATQGPYTLGYDTTLYDTLDVMKNSQLYSGFNMSKACTIPTPIAADVPWSDYLVQNGEPFGNAQGNTWSLNYYNHWFFAPVSVCGVNWILNGGLEQKVCYNPFSKAIEAASAAYNCNVQVNYAGQNASVITVKVPHECNSLHSNWVWEPLLPETGNTFTELLATQYRKVGIPEWDNFVPFTPLNTQSWEYVALNQRIKSRAPTYVGFPPGTFFRAATAWLGSSAVNFASPERNMKLALSAIKHKSWLSTTTAEEAELHSSAVCTAYLEGSGCVERGRNCNTEGCILDVATLDATLHLEMAGCELISSNCSGLRCNASLINKVVDVNLNDPLGETHWSCVGTTCNITTMHLEENVTASCDFCSSVQINKLSPTETHVSAVVAPPTVYTGLTGCHTTYLQCENNECQIDVTHDPVVITANQSYDNVTWSCDGLQCTVGVVHKPDQLTISCDFCDSVVTNPVADGSQEVAITALPPIVAVNADGCVVEYTVNNHLVAVSAQHEPATVDVTTTYANTAYCTGLHCLVEVPYTPDVVSTNCDYCDSVVVSRPSDGQQLVTITAKPPVVTVAASDCAVAYVTQGNTVDVTASAPLSTVTSTCSGCTIVTSSCIGSTCTVEAQGPNSCCVQPLATMPIYLNGALAVYPNELIRIDTGTAWAASRFSTTRTSESVSCYNSYATVFNPNNFIMYAMNYGLGSKWVMLFNQNITTTFLRMYPGAELMYCKVFGSTSGTVVTRPKQASDNSITHVVDFNPQNWGASTMHACFVKQTINMASVTEIPVKLVCN